MDEDSFKELLKLLPKKVHLDKDIITYDFQNTFRIYLMSYNLLNTLNYFDMEFCLDNDNCTDLLNDYFYRHKLNLEANNNTIYNRNLVLEGQSNSLNGRRYGFYVKNNNLGEKNYALSDSDPVLSNKTSSSSKSISFSRDKKVSKHSKFNIYHITVLVRYISSELGLTHDALISWDFEDFDNINPYNRPDYIQNIQRALCKLKKWCCWN